VTKAFLGAGLAFPFQFDSAGAVATAKYEDSVSQSVWMILGTAKGERVTRPDFGCGMYDLVFEVNSPSTSGKIAQAVREALLVQEPRIDVRNVQVTATDNGQTLLIEIEYRARATNNVFNLVYPFYLERSVT
jgi:uncharacterized protein